MSAADIKTHRYDVIVIGAGGAGLRAAIEAAGQGCSVGLICKSLLGKAHTVMAEGGAAAALGNVRSEDNWQTHFRDTMRGGKMLNNYRMAEIHAQEAPDRINELERWGALFDRTPEGKISQRPFGGHTYSRLAHIGDRTGLEMIRTLQDHVVHIDKITVYMECTVFRLLKDGDRVAGAFAYWRESGDFLTFHAKAVVLATGGIGKTYKVTSNSWEYTGDGHAMAYESGADLIDMEFLQFHPTGMVWPLSVRGILVTEAVRGEGGVLKNSEGRRFMFDNIPEAFKGDVADNEAEAQRWVNEDKVKNLRPPELLTRDVVARAITNEVREGRGSPHGGVFLDIASQRNAEDIKRLLPSMYHQFKELAGVDITKEQMEVGPTTHYVMGGIRVNPETAESTVKGLYAAGEVAAGMHGANRLGGNSLSDLLVFGRRAGLDAAKTAISIGGFPNLDSAQIEAAERDALAPLERESGENPYKIHEELQQLMNDFAGITRDQETLEKGLDLVLKLKARARNVSTSGARLYNTGWHLALDLDPLMVCSEALIRAAMARKESRGAHARVDFPDYDERYSKINHAIRKRGDEMTVVEEPLPQLPDDLMNIIGKGA